MIEDLQFSMFLNVVEDTLKRNRCKADLNALEIGLARKAYANGEPAYIAASVIVSYRLHEFRKMPTSPTIH
jgi:hypothetical protein